MQTSVVEVLKGAGLYLTPEEVEARVKAGKSSRLEEQMLITILPNNQRAEHKMAEIDFADIRTMADELDIALRHMNPIAQSLYAKNAVAIARAVRVVNVESASGFKGVVGSGRQLDLLLLRPEQFADPDVPVADPFVPTRRTTWERGVAGPPDEGEMDFIELLTEATAHSQDLEMGLAECLMIFGFADPVWVGDACPSAIQLRYLAQDYNIQNCDFSLVQPFLNTPILELKEPFVIYPRETGSVDAYYFQAGTDWLQPVGLWIKMASNLRNLATG